VSDELQIVVIQMLFFAGSPWALLMLAMGAFIFLVFVDNEALTNLVFPVELVIERWKSSQIQG
jgi:hypothetical protein